MGDEITYLFPNFNGTAQPLKFGDKKVISFQTLLGMWLHSSFWINIQYKNGLGLQH